MTDGFIILSDDSSGEEPSAPPAFATKSTASHESTRPRNIAVKKGASVPQAQPSPTISSQQKNKRDLETLQYSSNFLDNFNPQNSRREKNKRRTQQQQQTTRPQAKKTYNYTAIYDEQGRLKVNNQDICDCFDFLCPGCHFPCHYCASQKCGMRCRVNRKFMYDAIEHDGKDHVINNPFLANLLN
ncbi:unnamed protein product [Chironomus riparius]|uniref:ARF7 effector protein C-terminal domain-containing protein n=1 Tax=Chironomus riparius TaxID=315576 RepID=A0A9N9RVA7_9DIPT|nr:unnamed protein product [Chironomus riparius]